MIGDRALQTDVVDGQHVGSQLVEHQKHFRGPAPDPLHVDQRRDQRLVVEFFPLPGIEATRREMRSQIGKVLRLALRQAAAAQRRYRSSRDPLG